MLKRNRHRPRLKFGMELNAPRMNLMQYVLVSIGAENYVVIKLHGVKIYDYS